MRKHILVVGQPGTGKSMRAHELARQHAAGHGGIVMIASTQVVDHYGIERAMDRDPRVLIVVDVPADHVAVWQRLVRLSERPTWTLNRKCEPPRRTAAPQMIITASRLPDGWHPKPSCWTVIELDAGRMTA